MRLPTVRSRLGKMINAQAQEQGETRRRSRCRWETKLSDVDPPTLGLYAGLANHRTQIPFRPTGFPGLEPGSFDVTAQDPLFSRNLLVNIPIVPS